MHVYEAIHTRRSVRKYRPDSIPQEVLTRVLDAARIAPSGSNRQPTRLIVVTDDEIKAKLIPMCHDQAFVASAPVVIVACGRDIKYNRGEWMGRCAMIVDVVIAVDHLTLAARAEGLGTCWIGSFSDEQVKAILRIPEGWHVIALTPLGSPTGQPFVDTTDRKPLEEIVFYDTWQ